MERLWRDYGAVPVRARGRKRKCRRHKTFRIRVQETVIGRKLGMARLA